MTIAYTKDANTIFAISQDCVYKRKLYDELLWAEIDEVNGVVLRWEDRYMNKIICETVAEAQRIVETDYLQHTPHINGPRHELRNKDSRRI